MNSLKAALTLTLKDDLSAGLNRMRDELNKLRDVGAKLSLGKIGEAGAALRTIGTEVVGVTRQLLKMEGVADRAWSHMKRIAAGPMGRVRHAFSQEGKIGHAFSQEGKLGAMGAAVQGISVIEPIHTYADFQDLALRAAITQGLSGKAANNEANSLMSFFRHDARETGQSSTGIAEAYLDLIQTGMAPAIAKALLPVHSKAATAYGIDPEALGHAVFALSDTLKIGEKDMGGALAAMALAAQKGRFKIEDFSRSLPGITGNMAKLGMTGRGSADVAFAALETVMRNSSDAGQGATNFTDFMNYLTSPMAARSFALQSRGMAPQTKALLDKYHITGINMPAVLGDARKKGMNPLEAVLGVLQAKVRGLPPDVMAEVLGAFFHNQQARDAAVALLLHSNEYLGLKGQLGHADAGKLDTDFNTRSGGAAVQTKKFGEALSELGQTLGRGFLPILLVVNGALGWLLDTLDWLDARMPGVENAILLVVGAMLSLGAAAGAIGFVWPAVSAGFDLLAGGLQLLWGGLMLAVKGVFLLLEGIAAVAGVSAGVVVAILALAAVLAAMVIDIYEHWGAFRGFFAAQWQGIKDIFSGFAEFLLGLFLGDMGMAWNGLTRIWSGLGAYFAGTWGIIRQLFVDFGSWVDGWTGGAMTAAVNAIKHAWSGLKEWFAGLWQDIRKPFDDFAGYVANSAVGRLLHLSGAPQLQAPGGRGAAANQPATNGPDLSGASYLMPQAPHAQVSVGVGVDPNNGQVRVTHVHSDSPAVHATGMPDPGQVLGTP